MALEPIFAKLAYAGGDVLQTITIRGIVIALVGACYVIITHKSSFKVSVKEFSYMCYLALFGTLIADLLYYYALTKIPVVNAVLIGHMQPIFIVLWGYFVLKEDQLNNYDYLGIGAILYYEGLKRIKVVQVSALELSTPFFAVFLSFFILGERSTMMQIIGILFLFVGIYFLSKKEN